MKRSLGRRFSRRRFLAGTGAVAAGVALMPKGSWGVEEPKLNFYNWDTYIGETTLDDFKRTAGIEVKMDLFADNEELFAKLKEGNPGYDVIVPTNNFVERMVTAKMLLPLNRSPDHQLQEPRSRLPGGRIRSGPQVFHALHVGHPGHRLSQVGGQVGRRTAGKRCSIPTNTRAAISVLSDPVNNLGAAFKYLGYSYNSTNPAEIKEAEELLIKQKPHIKVFADDNGQDLLLSGEVDLTMEWNGDILQVMEEDDDISYVVPKEGSNLLWQDCLCIRPARRIPRTPTSSSTSSSTPRRARRSPTSSTTPRRTRRAQGSCRTNTTRTRRSSRAMRRSRAARPRSTQGEEGQRIYDETWTRVLAA